MFDNLAPETLVAIANTLHARLGSSQRVQAFGSKRAAVEHCRDLLARLDDQKKAA